MATLKLHKGGKATDRPPVIHQPTFMPLRCALDWCTLLYSVFVTARVWKALVAVAKNELRVIATETPDGEHLPLEASLQGNDAAVILKGVGVWVKVKNPNLRPQNDGAKDDGVEIQIQGSALATTTDGGVATIRALRDAVHGALFRHHGPNHEARTEALRPFARPGRFDVASDVAVQGPDAALWIEHELYKAGHLTHASRAIVTRARKPKTIADVSDTILDKPHRKRETIIGRQQGTERQGRTLYVGSQVCLRIYQKEKVPADSSKVLLSTLKEHCAWNGTDPLLRWEVEIKRAWFRDQMIELHGEAIRGDKITAEDFLDNAQLFAQTALARFRHTEDTPGARKNRPNTPFYDAVLASLDFFHRPPRFTMQGLMSKKRERLAHRAVVQTIGGLVDIAAQSNIPFEKLPGMMSFPGMSGMLLDEFTARRDHYHKRYTQLRLRLGLERGINLEDIAEEEAVPEAAAG